MGDEASDDLVQEAFVLVWTKSDSWNGSGSPVAWVFRVATNLALNFLRTRARRREAPLDQSGEDEELNSVLRRLESDLPGPDAVAERRQVIAVVRRMIGALPESKREVMDLVHTEDLSVAETAETLGIPTGTVKSRLHYGRLAIEDHIREFFDQKGET